MIDNILSNANSFARKTRKMVGPIFSGGLIRESLEDMLTFKEDTMFRPSFYCINYSVS